MADSSKKESPAARGRPHSQFRYARLQPPWTPAPDEIVEAEEAIWVVDTHGRLVIWSRGAMKLLGYAPEGIVGSCASTLLLPEDSLEGGEPGDVIQLLTERGIVADHRTRLLHRAGYDVPVSMTAVQLSDAKGDLCGYLIIARGIMDPSSSPNGRASSRTSVPNVRRKNGHNGVPDRQPVLGQSEAIKQALRTVARVANSDASVLIAGESGTGKELLAHAIHRHSPRSCCPFVAVNCAAIPEHLLESELFGHEKGSFTGADRRRIGKFERASCGTMFLDEIGDMSQGLQAKILRALEEREIERVGGDGPVPVDLRVVAASNRCLRTDIQDGRFREDLYYRLAVVVIDLPPLRERGDDVFLLADHFLHRHAARNGVDAPSLSPEARELLAAYHWPGNVRELKNAMERAALMATDDFVLPEHLPHEIASGALEPVLVSAAANGDGAEFTLRQSERRAIAHVMASVHGNQSRAAEILGIHRNTLRTKLRQHGLI